MMSGMEGERADLAALQEAIRVTFRDESLLQRALTHTSYLNENLESGGGDNERLEFLGDAVGDFVAAEYLYRLFPDWQEGQLTELRAELVRSETLAGFAQRIGLGRYLHLGRGEEHGGGRARVPLLADALEALLGAVYVDQGLEAARRFFVPLLETEVGRLSVEPSPRDPKSRLQEVAQDRFHEAPSYVTVQETGPDHAKLFTVEVRFDGQTRGRGDGRTKQAAEQQAARAALDSHELDLPSVSLRRKEDGQIG